MQDKSYNKGFTILEVLICILIASSLLIAFGSPFVQATKMLDRTQGSTLAMSIADQQIQKAISDVQEGALHGQVPLGEFDVTHEVLGEVPDYSKLENLSVLKEIDQCYVCDSDSVSILVMVSWGFQNQASYKLKMIHALEDNYNG